jgi:hypothetical protein
MVLAGGNRNNGSNAGVFNLNLNNAVGNSNWNIVGRLSDLLSLIRETG